MFTSRLVVVAIWLFVGVHSFTWDEPTALDDYVNFDDGYFSWSELTTYRFEENATTVYMLNMTSQKWMDETLTSKPIWYHMMGIAIPDVVKHDAAYMWIEGGSNNDDTGPAPPDDELVFLILNMAVEVGCIGAYIRQVPNQSMVFTNDPEQKSRTEDAIIAWTWHTFITTHMDQPEVILRMPMTKAAKRGMDTVTEFVQQKVPGLQINRFIPGGGSKRGWTTWSVAAMDQRVVAATPVVMSLLNFNDSLQAHYRNLGGAWSFAFSDYYECNLTARIHDDIVLKSPGGLWDYEDMFRYKERLGLIPKLMVSAAGDEFFMLTDSHSWWSQMPGEKWLMMVPNAEHSLVPWYRKVGETIASWLICFLEELQIPSMSWFRMETPSGGLMRFSTDMPPNNLSVWQAFTWKNDTRKDFRLAVGYPPFIHPVLWHRIPYQDLGYGHYLIEVERPEVGFTGIFFEAAWNYPRSYLTFTMTTEVHVSPETFPGDPCYADECYGYLI
jgi:PhoPQ-activated pathogenicity-related protein